MSSEMPSHSMSSVMPLDMAFETHTPTADMQGDIMTPIPDDSTLLFRTIDDCQSYSDCQSFDKSTDDTDTVQSSEASCVYSVCELQPFDPGGDTSRESQTILADEDDDPLITQIPGVAYYSVHHSSSALQPPFYGYCPYLYQPLPWSMRYKPRSKYLYGRS